MLSPSSQKATRDFREYRDAILVFAVKIASSFLALLFVWLITARVPASEAGIFLLSLSLINVFGVFFTRGYGPALVKLIAGDLNGEMSSGATLLLKAFFRCSVTALPLMIVLLVLVWGLGYTEYAFHFGISESVLICVGVLAFSLNQLMAHALLGASRPIISALIINFWPHCGAIIVFLITSAESASGVIGSFALGLIFSILGAGFLLFKSIKLGSEVSQHISATADSIANTVWGLISMSLLVQWSSMLVMGWFIAPEFIAGFSIAHRISLLVSLLVVAITSVWSPQFSRLFNKGQTLDLCKSYSDASQILMFLGIPLCVLMLIYSGQLMELFGEEYREFKYLLQILLLGQIINVLTGPAGTLLNMTGREKKLRTVVMISGTGAMTASIVFIPWGGIVAAAIITSMAVVVQNLMCFYYAHKHLSLSLSYLPSSFLRTDYARKFWWRR